MSNQYIIGIDTSNYTTSVGIIDKDNKIIADERMILSVKKGERGLRQSDANFQHIKNLPTVFTKAMESIDPKDIVGISVSTKPRDVENSYMPVFLSGHSVASIVSNTLNVPLLEFSHQEGHIAAIKNFVKLNDTNNFICFHLSGGTSEILKVTNDKVEIIGGTLDISFGQLIDRIGVLLGYDFPAGAAMDKLALEGTSNSIQIKNIKTDGLNFNLSGIETGFSRIIDEHTPYDIASALFNKITICLQQLVKECNTQYEAFEIIFAGGVSESVFLKDNIKDVLFGQYGADNGLGVALLGGQKVWQSNR